MRTVRLVAGEWSSLALQASTFLDRLLGLRVATPNAGGLLIRTRSVHTIGLGRPIEVVIIDRDLRVLETAPLPRNRVLIRRPAWFMLELPAGSDLPPLQSQLEIIDG